MTGADDLAVRLETDGLVETPAHVFALDPAEAALLTPDQAAAGVKNISLAPHGAVKGTSADGEEFDALTSLLRRYAAWSRSLIETLAPAYAAALTPGRTSFRPRAVEDADLTDRKDDRRLHVDAFASQPTGGERILRVFSNINPEGRARHWQVGEPFEDHARRFVPGVRGPFPGEAAALRAFGLTKARRTPYDFFMLALHDRAKLDLAYQREAPRRDLAFAAGATWIVFTDSTVHAALRGRYALEQTFYLPISAMARPQASPLRILERLTGKRLA